MLLTPKVLASGASNLREGMVNPGLRARIRNVIMFSGCVRVNRCKCGRVNHLKKLDLRPKIWTLRCVSCRKLPLQTHSKLGRHSETNSLFEGILALCWAVVIWIHCIITAVMNNMPTLYKSSSYNVTFWNLLKNIYTSIVIIFAVFVSINIHIVVSVFRIFQTLTPFDVFYVIPHVK